MEMNFGSINAEFIKMMNGLSGVVASEPGFQNMQNYIRGLLGNAERKNGWQLSEYVGEETPYALQQFLYKGRFCADKLRDGQRRKKAGVPEGLTFKTKPEMALEMIREATNAGVPYKWVTGDSVYGNYTNIRTWLESQGKCYVLCLSGKAYVWRGWKQEKISGIMKNLPEEGWFGASCGDGSKGARVYDWLTLPINPGTTEGFERSLLIRRSKGDPTDQRAYVCFAPIETPRQRLAEVAGSRWTVETCFKEGKSEVGLDEYEVRKYEAWYKHITLACVALAFLTVLSCKSLDTKSLQQHNPAASSLKEFKKGRNPRV